MTDTSKDVERIEAESVPQADLCDTSDPQADSVEPVTAHWSNTALADLLK